MASNTRPFNQNESFSDSWMPYHEFESIFPDCYIERAQKGSFSTGRPRLMLQAIDSAGVVQSRRFAMELENKFKPGTRRVFVSRTELVSVDQKPALFVPAKPAPIGLEDVYADPSGPSYALGGASPLSGLRARVD